MESLSNGAEARISMNGMRSLDSWGQRSKRHRFCWWETCLANM